MSTTPTPTVRVLYTAEATATGGRKGHGRTSDGRLDVDFSSPTEMGGDGGPGTNPEQLFATGFAACFRAPSPLPAYSPLSCAPPAARTSQRTSRLRTR